MKRILSLVLALVLVLGSVPMTFAADQSAGEMLKAAGFVAGDQAGNLNEDQKLTREQMMVLIAEMNGVKEEAATFGIPADFSDVSENDWFAPYVWYAFYQGWTTGMGDGTFGAGKAVDSKMAATFMLKALGYEVADYNASVEQAAGVGIEVAETAEMTRGEGFTAMWSTVNLPKEGSDVALGVELGRLEVETPEVVALDVEIDEAYAVGTKVIDVVLTADVDAADAEAADFSVVKKGTSEEVDVERVVAVAADRVYVYTEELKAGSAYTVVLGESTYNFSGLYKETDKPEIESVVGEDTGLIEVEFDTNVDWDSATDIANYSIDKEGTVVDAKVKDDYKTVELYVEGITKRQALKLTTENVMNADGVKMDKDVNSFYPVEDDDAPSIEDVNPERLDNNFEVAIYFDDDHGVDKATAEDVSNYSIEGVEILSAEVDDVYWDDDSDEEKDTDNDYWNKVTLKTSEMDAGDKYELKILYMVDGSLSKNATTKTLEKTFRAGSEDDDEPKLDDAEALSENIVKITFKDDNDLDPATALDVSNYEFEDDDLSIYNVWFKDDDEEEQILYMETSTMDTDENYTLIVNNIADIVGNTMDEDDEKTFDLDDVNYNGASAVKKVEVVDLETLIVEFSDPVKGVDAEDPTNYEIDGVGKAIDAEWDEDSDGDEYDYRVVITVEELDNNDEYTLIVDGIENFADRTMDDYEFDFIATSDENDDERPEVENVSEEQDGIVLVEFSEEMEMGDGVPDAVMAAAYPTWTELTSTGNAIDPTYRPALSPTYAVVKVTDDSEDLVAGDTYYMVATTTTDDDETVVFNGYRVYATAGGALVNLQGKDVEFEIVSFSSNLTDTALNTVDYDDDEEVSLEPDFTADTVGTTTATNSKAYLDKDSVEVDSADQESPDEVHVYFDEKIQILSEADIEAINDAAFTNKNSDGDVLMPLYKDSNEDGKLSTTEGGSADYDVTLDDDSDETLLILDLDDADYFNEDDEILIVDLNEYVTDLIGRPVSMETISFDTNNEEDDEPKVDEVRAINEREIEIEWNVNLSDAGDYYIVNKDDDDWNDGKLDSFEDVDYDDNIVTIILKEGSSWDLLDGDDTYEITVDSNVESIFGENSDCKGDDFTFAGSSTPYVGNPFTGVSYINGTKLEVIDDDDFVTGDAFVSITQASSSKVDDAIAGGVKEYDPTTDTYLVAFPTNDDDFYLVVEDYTPFLDGVKYDVTVTPGADRRLEGGTADIVVGTVTGTVEVLSEFETTSGTSIAYDLKIDNLESDADFTYTLYVFDIDGDDDGVYGEDNDNDDAVDIDEYVNSSTLIETITLVPETGKTGTTLTNILLDEEMLKYEFTGTAISGDVATHAILVVKEGDNVRYVTSEIELDTVH